MQGQRQGSTGSIGHIAHHILRVALRRIAGVAITITDVSVIVTGIVTIVGVTALVAHDGYGGTSTGGWCGGDVDGEARYVRALSSWEMVCMSCSWFVMSIAVSKSMQKDGPRQLLLGFKLCTPSTLAKTSVTGGGWRLVLHSYGGAD